MPPRKVSVNNKKLIKKIAINGFFSISYFPAILTNLILIFSQLSHVSLSNCFFHSFLSSFFSFFIIYILLNIFRFSNIVTMNFFNDQCSKELFYLLFIFSIVTLHQFISDKGNNAFLSTSFIYNVLFISVLFISSDFSSIFLEQFCHLFATHEKMQKL